MDKRNMICISCPMGCSLEVETRDGEYFVTGNTCKRGIDYAVAEITNPTRTVTTSVFVGNGTHPTVSVKTSSEVSKKLIGSLMKELACIRVEAPVRIGDAIIRNVLGTGVDIVATRNVEKG